MYYLSPSGLSFLVSGYELPVLTEIKDSLVRFGAASVYTQADYDGHSSVNYCILTMTGEGLIAANAQHYVTHVFVEDCSHEEVASYILLS